MSGAGPGPIRPRTMDKAFTLWTRPIHLYKDKVDPNALRYDGYYVRGCLLDTKGDIIMEPFFGSIMVVWDSDRGSIYYHPDREVEDEEDEEDNEDPNELPF